MDSNNFFKYLDTFENRNSILVEKFWKRIDFYKSLKQKKVLDFGSGTGCLSTDLAEKGADFVTGVDNDEKMTSYSNYRLNKNFFALKKKVHFTTKELNKFDSESFDVVFSKDTFEHLHGPDYFLKEFHRVLKPNGEVILGFGPLWRSPFGDHGVIKEAFGFRIPWLHVLLGQELVRNFFNNSSLKKGNPYSPRLMKNVHDYLNMTCVDEFKKIIEDSPFEIISYRENVHENIYLNFISQFKVPAIFKNYWIRNIYCRLKKG